MVIKERHYLPGQPRIDLQDPSIAQYLETEFLTRDLDRLAPHLWLVATQSSSHISSLTHQIVRGRNIILTEKPELHLVWIYDRVFIKPIPKYLLSNAFWKFYLLEKASPIPEPLRHDIRKAAVGFLQSYIYLIQHKSDFRLAKNETHRLLPKKVSYHDFIKFITAFREVQDEDVSPRYRFGELRLTRLNLWSKILLRRFTYQKVHWQYGAYLAQFYGPLLFIFAVLKISLSAMQVGIAALPSVRPSSWAAFVKVSQGFPVFTLILVMLLISLLLLMFLSLSFREVAFATKDLYRERKSTRRNGVENGTLAGYANEKDV